jgi:hypothetical protein
VNLVSWVPPGELAQLSGDALPVHHFGFPKLAVEIIRGFTQGIGSCPLKKQINLAFKLLDGMKPSHIKLSEWQVILSFVLPVINARIG